MRQYTDTLGGNWSPAVLKEGENPNRIAFVSYYKGDYTLRTLERKEPLHTAATSDFGAPGPIIDFQAPLQHTLVADNVRKKKTFEKMFLDGRPPVSLGVTSSGDIFGGTAVTFGDVLGDKQFNFYFASISQYRTFSLVLHQPVEAVPVRPAGLLADGVLLRPARRRVLRSVVRAVPEPQRRAGHEHDVGRHGVRHLPAQPVQPDSGLGQLRSTCSQTFNDPTLQRYSSQYQSSITGGQQLAQNRRADAARRRVRPRDDGVPRVRAAGGQHDAVAWRLLSPPIGGLLSRRTFDADVRHYTRLGSTGLLAMRFHGFRSRGDFPDFQYFGGNGDLRGYDYLQFVGQNMLQANAELRFPLIEAALTPIGVIGGIRGVLFAGVGGAWFSDQKTANPCGGTTDNFRFLANSTQTVPGRYGRQDRCASATSSSTPIRCTGRPVARRSITDRAAGRRLPPAGRPRVVRHRPRDVRAGLPDPLRLVVAHADEPGMGERGLLLRQRPAQRRLRQRRGRLPASRASRSGLGTTSNERSRSEVGEKNALEGWRR